MTNTLWSKWGYEDKDLSDIPNATEDYRCPICEAIQMYTVLKCRGIESKLVGFKGENHELSRSGKPLHRSKRLFEITNWMEIHLK